MSGGSGGLTVITCIHHSIIVELHAQLRNRMINRNETLLRFINAYIKNSSPLVDDAIKEIELIQMMEEYLVNTVLAGDISAEIVAQAEAIFNRNNEQTRYARTQKIDELINFIGRPPGFGDLSPVAIKQRRSPFSTKRFEMRIQEAPKGEIPLLLEELRSTLIPESKRKHLELQLMAKQIGVKVGEQYGGGPSDSPLLSINLSQDINNALPSNEMNLNGGEEEGNEEQVKSPPRKKKKQYSSAKMEMLAPYYEAAEISEQQLVNLEQRVSRLTNVDINILMQPFLNGTNECVDDGITLTKSARTVVHLLIKSRFPQFCSTTSKINFRRVCGTDNCWNLMHVTPEYKSSDPTKTRERAESTILAGKCTNAIKAASKLPITPGLTALSNELLSDFTIPLQNELKEGIIAILKALFHYTKKSVGELRDLLVSSSDMHLMEKDETRVIESLLFRLAWTLSTKGRSYCNTQMLACRGNGADEKKICLFAKHVMIDSKLLRSALQYQQIFPAIIHDSESPEIKQSTNYDEAEAEVEIVNEDGNENIVEPVDNNQPSEGNEYVQIFEEEEDQMEFLLPDEILENTRKELEAIKETLPKPLQTNWKKLLDTIDNLFCAGIEPPPRTQVNTTDVEREVREVLAQKVTKGSSPRAHNSYEITVLYLTHFVKVKYAVNFVQIFEEQLGEEVIRQTEEAIEEKLQQWVDIVINTVTNQLTPNGFTTEYPLSKRDATIIKAGDFMRMFVCYMTAAFPECNPADDFINLEFMNNAAKQFEQHLLYKYTRQSLYRDGIMNFSRGAKTASRRSDSTEPNRLALTSVSGILCAVGVGLKLSAIYYPSKKTFVYSTKEHRDKVFEEHHKSRLSLPRPIVAITEFDVDAYLDAKPIQTAYDLTVAILLKLSARYGFRMSSVIPYEFSKSSAHLPSPGIKLMHIKIDFINGVPEIVIEIVFHKTQASAGESRKKIYIRYDNSKYDLCRLILLLLELREAYAVPLLQGLQECDLPIKEAMGDLCLFVKHDSSGRFTDIPFSVGNIDTIFDKMSEVLNIPRQLLIFRCFRKGNAVTDGMEVMQETPGTATKDSIEKRLKSNPNWDSDAYAKYLDVHNNEFGRALELYNTHVKVNPAASPYHFYRFASSIYSNESFLKPDDILVNTLMNCFSPHWFYPDDKYLKEKMKHRRTMIHSELNVFIYSAIQNSFTTRSVGRDTTQTISLTEMLGFYCYPLSNSEEIGHYLACPEYDCNYIAENMSDIKAHLQSHPYNDAKLVCKACETECAKVKNPTAKRGLYANWEKHISEAHCLRYCCRTCQFSIPMDLKYDCDRRRHNVVNAGSLRLHFEPSVQIEFPALKGYNFIDRRSMSAIIREPLNEPVIEEINVPCDMHEDATNPLTHIQKLKLNMNRINHWTVNEVANLIKLVLSTMEAEQDTFIAQQIDGEGLMLLTTEDMKSFGMVFGSILKIRKLIQFIKLELEKRS